jgi:DNA-binding transcriptional LysR family regulator
VRGRLSDVDLRLLRVFLAVVGAGGISPAQLGLNVGASTISMQLAALETRLGYRLCERGRGGFRLTAKGEAFTELARGLLSSINDFGQAARNLDKQLVGHLRIGLIGHMPPGQNRRLAQAIAKFRGRNEAVRLTLLVRSPAELEEALLNGSIELAIAYFWHRVPALRFTPLFHERHEAYCGKGHPLFERAGKLTREEVDKLDWAWRTYPLPEAGLAGPPPIVGGLADNMEALSLLVLSGHHLGFLPEHYAAPYVEDGLLAALNPATLRYDTTFHAVTRLRRHLNEVTKAFLDDLGAVYLAGSSPSAKGSSQS